MLFVCCLAIGAAIGAVGIGGVLLVPALALVGGLAIEEAIATAMWCFLFTGAVGVAAYGRRGQIDWWAAAWLCGALMPGAFAGALLVHVLAEGWVAAVVVAVLVASAGLIPRRRAEGAAPWAAPSRRLGARAALVIGAVAGIGSSASGTGGPLIVLPLLLWRGVPVLEAIGLAQVSQIPIALSASAGHLAKGPPPLLQATVLALGLAAGVLAGARLAPWLPAPRLRQAVAITALVAALAMLDRLTIKGPATLGADRGFDAGDFIAELRERWITPHVAQSTSGRRSAIDGRTTRHPGYAHSQRARKRIEEAFGWIKTIAGQARTRYRGLQRVRWSFTFAAAAYNLIRLPRLIGAAP